MEAMKKTENTIKGGNWGRASNEAWKNIPITSHDKEARIWPPFLLLLDFLGTIGLFSHDGRTTRRTGKDTSQRHRTGLGLDKNELQAQSCWMTEFSSF